jgi:hypothetical protein
MQPATKPVVPVVLVRSSEHVHPDVVFTKQTSNRKKRKKEKEDQKNKKKKNCKQKMHIAALMPEEIFHVHDMEEKRRLWQVSGVRAFCLQPSENVPVLGTGLLV